MTLIFDVRLELLTGYLEVDSSYLEVGIFGEKMSKSDNIFRHVFLF